MLYVSVIIAGFEWTDDRQGPTEVLYVSVIIAGVEWTDDRRGH